MGDLQCAVVLGSGCGEIVGWQGGVGEVAGCTTKEITAAGRGASSDERSCSQVTMECCKRQTAAGESTDCCRCIYSPLLLPPKTRKDWLHALAQVSLVQIV